MKFWQRAILNILYNDPKGRSFLQNTQFGTIRIAEGAGPPPPPVPFYPKS